MFCAKCGNQLDDSAVICPRCGVPTENFKATAPQAAPQAQQTVRVEVNNGQQDGNGSAINIATVKKIGGALLLAGGIVGAVNAISAGDLIYLAIGIVIIAAGSCLLSWGIYGS